MTVVIILICIYRDSVSTINQSKRCLGALPHTDHWGVLCIALVVDQLLDGLKATPFVWHEERLKYVRKWSVVATDTFDRSLQVEKTLGLFNKYLQ